jgi:hypothetical protein
MQGRAYTLAQSLTHAQLHVLTRSCTCACAYARTIRHGYAHRCTRTGTRLHVFARMRCVRVQECTCVSARARTRARAQTHTYTRAQAQSFARLHALTYGHTRAYRHWPPARKYAHRYQLDYTFRNLWIHMHTSQACTFSRSHMHTMHMYPRNPHAPSMHASSQSTP